MQYYGYAGKILYIDLTTGQYRTEPLDMSMAKKFIGGCGIGERLLYDILKPGIDPLSPGNPIIISAGPLIGTGVPGANKIQMLTKSTVTADRARPKYFVPRASGGSRLFGIMMKNAGYDQIVITGQAKKPVYLKILDDDVEICNADDLWGKRDIYETTNELTNRHKGAGVIAIGRAGENMVPFALCWIDHISHIGRNGGAAIMGSKNLKAILIRGTKRVNVWNSQRLKMLTAKAIREAMKTPRYKMRQNIGRAWNLPAEWANLYPYRIFDDTLIGWSGCRGCVFACKDSHEIKDGEFAGGILKSRFWYTLNGRRLGLKDYRHAMKLVEVCNRYGICYLTVTAMIRFITRLHERGLINRNAIDGLEPSAGDINTYLELVEKTVVRDGIGDSIARGWYALADKFGIDPNTDNDGDQIEKGCTVFFDARLSSLNPATFAEIVNTKPGAELHPITIMPNLTIDSIREWCRGLAMSTEEIGRTFVADDFNTGRLTKHIEDGECVYWALGTCTTWSYSSSPQVYSLSMLANLYSTVTGIDTTADELKRIGERIWNMGKMLNVREGFTRADDVLPGLWAKAIDEPIKTSKGDVYLKDYFGRLVTHASFEKMLDDYYDEHGWDIKSGIPTKHKLAELGLEELVNLP